MACKIMKLFFCFTISIMAFLEAAGQDTLRIISCGDSPNRKETRASIHSFDLSSYRYIQLRCMGLEAIAKFNLSKVEYLDISLNPIKVLSNVTMVNLKYLVVDDNLLEIDSTICSSKQLIEIRGGLIRKLPKCICEIPTLKFFNTWIDFDSSAFLSACKQLTNMNLFSFNNEPIDWVHKMPSLTHLGVLNADFLPIPRISIDNVKTLSMSWNPMKNDSLVMFLSSFPNLTALEIYYSSNIFDIDLSIFSKLEKLIIMKTDGNLIDLKIDLSKFQNLKEIYVSKNVEKLSVPNHIQILVPPNNKEFDRKLKKLGLRAKPGQLGLSVLDVIP